MTLLVFERSWVVCVSAGLHIDWVGMLQPMRKLRRYASRRRAGERRRLRARRSFPLTSCSVEPERAVI